MTYRSLCFPPFITAVNSSRLIDKIFAAIKSDVSTALSTGTLCKRLATSAGERNVSSIMAPIAIKNMCNKTAVFVTAFIAAPLIPISMNPTGQPTSTPSSYQPPPKTSIVSQKMIGLLSIMFLIGVLRFIPSLIDIFYGKKVQKGGHLYNILVVLKGEEMAVLENIRHEDISFFRKMTIESAADTLNWQMNATSNILEKHQEVRFFDVYDLLGSKIINQNDEILRERSSKGNRVVRKEVLRDKTQLQTGMIILVRPASGWVHKESFDDLRSINSDADLESCRESMVRLKGGGQKASVLEQLPSCFITNTPPAKPSGAGMDFRNMLPRESTSSKDLAALRDAARCVRDVKTSRAPSDSDSFRSCDSRPRLPPSGKSRDVNDNSLLHRHTMMREARARGEDSDGGSVSTPRRKINSQNASAACTPRSLSCIAGAEETNKWSSVSSRSYNLNDSWKGERCNWRADNDSDDTLEWRAKQKIKEKEEHEANGEGQDDDSSSEEEKNNSDLDDDVVEEKNDEDVGCT